MTFYEAVAEKGVSVCQGPNKLVQWGSDLAGLSPADRRNDAGAVFEHGEELL
jgi:hypothetical protein